MTNGQSDPLPVPSEVEKRIKIWHDLYIRANYSHYLVGIVGVAASAIAAAVDGNIAKICAAISATCIAILGFAQPDRKYMKFVRAWRILYVAALKYRYRQIELPELINAVELGEKSITDLEQDISNRSLPTLKSEP